MKIILLTEITEVRAHGDTFEGIALIGHNGENGHILLPLTHNGIDDATTWRAKDDTAVQVGTKFRLTIDQTLDDVDMPDEV